MTVRSLTTARDLFVVAARRLSRAWLWIVLQIAGIAALIAVGLLWTRIAEKNAWQVILTLLIPLVVAAGFLALQAGFLRSMLRSAPGRDRKPEVSFAFGSLTLLLWIVIGWVLWALVDRFDANTVGWASYLNSRFNSDMRARVFTYEHLQKWLEYAGWFLRWVVVPGLLIPLGCSSLHGLRRLPWGRVSRAWISWLWWIAALALALIGESVPQIFFESDPSGSVKGQIARVFLKLIAAYLLGVLCWVLGLAWAATMVAGADPPEGSADGDEAQGSNRIEGRPLPLGNAEDHLTGNA